MFDSNHQCEEKHENGNQKSQPAFSQNVNSWSNLTIIVSVPCHVNVPIHTPITCPLVLYNPVILSVTNNDYCMVNCCIKRARENTWTITWPSIGSKSNCDWANLQQINHFFVSHTIIVLYIITTNNSICWTDSAVACVKIIRVSFF